MRFSELTEEYLTTIITHLKKECEIFKNPSRKELRSLISYDSVRAIILGDDLLAWNPEQAMHVMVVDGMKLPNTFIPIIMSFHGRDLHVEVTDASRNSHYWHNPEIVDEIHNNPYLKRNFNDIEISYYDEAVVGSWDNIEESED